jgi:hypothetical protein
MSWIEKLHRAQAELAERDVDPFRGKAEGAARGIEAISTAALLDLLRESATIARTAKSGRFSTSSLLASVMLS